MSPPLKAMHSFNRPSLLLLLVGVYLLTASPIMAIRLPDELQPLSTKEFSFVEHFYVTHKTPPHICIHSSGGLIDLEIRRVRSEPGGRDTLRIWEATEISPRETIDRWVVDRSGVTRYADLQILQGMHYVGFELTPESGEGIYEVRIDCELDGMIVNVQAGGGKTSRRIVPIGDITHESAKVAWLGRGTVSERFDFSRHHTAVTNADSIIFLGGSDTLADAGDERLYGVRAFDKKGAAFVHSSGEPGFWSARFGLAPQSAMLSLGNLSSRRDLRMEHFFVVWDGAVVEEIVPSSGYIRFAETVAVKNPPWDTRYEVCIQVAQPRPGLDLDKIRLNAVPTSFVSGDWVAQDDTVWGTRVEGTADRQRVRFTRDSRNTSWTLHLINETESDTVYVMEEWNQERFPTLRYVPYAIGRAGGFVRSHPTSATVVGGLFTAVLAAVALLHRRDREKASLLASLKRELGRAREIQLSLFPSDLLRKDDVEVAGDCRSMEEVGGDYYDFFTFRDGTIVFTIADVAGHGYAAALRMSGIHYHLHRDDIDSVDPGRTLTDLNRNLATRERPGEFVTHFLACVSPDQQRLRYANAGHPRALLVRRDGTIERLEPTGLPLGIFPETQYGEATLEIRPDDLLVAYTDGLLETTNADDEEFGESRVISVLTQYVGGEPDTIVKALFDSAEGFSGRAAQSDDIAIVAAKLGAGASSSRRSYDLLLDESPRPSPIASSPPSRYDPHRRAGDQTELRLKKERTG